VIGFTLLGFYRRLYMGFCRLKVFSCVWNPQEIVYFFPIWLKLSFGQHAKHMKTQTNVKASLNYTIYDTY